MRNLLLSALLSVVATLPAQAQDNASVSAHNMRLAIEVCLLNYRTEPGLSEAFLVAGFTLYDGLDPGSYEFEADGVSGLFTTRDATGYCTVQSPLVPLATAEALGAELATTLFPGNVVAGGPEHPVGTPVPPCAGLSVFALQQLITITYAAAGNSGECLIDGTSAVIISM